MLAHIRLAASHGDETIGRDRVPDARFEIGGCGRRERLIDAGAGIAEHEAGCSGADQEGTAAEVGRLGSEVFHVLVHVALRSDPEADAVRMSDAARMMAFWIRE